jgi:alpha-tubulin suppressor-like RCC1 family protein
MKYILLMHGVVWLLVAAAVFAVDNARADSAYAWGDNSSGQLGDGTHTSRNSPAPVSGLSSGVTAVGAGNSHSLAIMNGGVYAWGYNGDGQVDSGTNDLTIPLPVPVTGMSSGVTAVAGGEAHSVAIQNGGAYAWGYNSFGQLGDGTYGPHSTPAPVNGLSSGVIAIAATYSHNLAIQNGAAFGWGSNLSGEVGNGSNDSTIPQPVPVTGMSSGVTAISVGLSFSLAVRNGGVYAWGNNAFGQIGDGTTTSRSTPVALTGDLASGVTAVAASRVFSLAVQNGHVYAWGFNALGQLGDGTTTDHHTPELIDSTDLHNIVAVAAGFDSSYALSSDGSIWDWGDSSYGQLGLGDFQSHLTPQHLLPPVGYRFTSIAANCDHSSAIATLAAVSEPATPRLLLVGILTMCCRRRLKVS